MKIDKVIENGVILSKVTYHDGRDGGKYVHYYLDYKLHREIGPAIIRYTPNGDVKSQYYYLNGKEIEDDLQIMVMEGLGG